MCFLFPIRPNTDERDNGRLSVVLFFLSSLSNTRIDRRVQREKSQTVSFAQRREGVNVKQSTLFSSPTRLLAMTNGTAKAKQPSRAPVYPANTSETPSCSSSSASSSSSTAAVRSSAKASSDNEPGGEGEDDGEVAADLPVV